MFDVCVKCWFVPKYVQRLFDFKSKPRGCLINDDKIVTGQCTSPFVIGEKVIDRQSLYRFITSFYRLNSVFHGRLFSEADILFIQTKK